jgi:uncharacterized membrane protein (UPF0127 family)
VAIFNNQFKKILPILVGLILGVSVFSVFSPKSASDYNAYLKKEVLIGDAHYSMAVADTDVLRTRGLSGKKSLPEGMGMLFIFPVPDQYAFWMKEMNFPIDIIWVSSEKKIIYIKENATPASYPELFQPEDDATAVLEVQAGDAKKYNFSIGEEIQILPPK